MRNWTRVCTALYALASIPAADAEEESQKLDEKTLVLEPITVTATPLKAEELHIAQIEISPPQEKQDLGRREQDAYKPATCAGPLPA